MKLSRHFELDIYRFTHHGGAVAFGFTWQKFTMYQGGLEFGLILGVAVLRMTYWNAIPGERKTQWPSWLS